VCPLALCALRRNRQLEEALLRTPPQLPPLDQASLRCNNLLDGAQAST